MFAPGPSLTFASATSVLQAGLQAIAGGQDVIDLAGVTAADSSAVAVLLAWRRAARARSAPLRFVHLPANVRSLIALYDVSVLLDGADSDPSSFVRADLPHH